MSFNLRSVSILVAAALLFGCESASDVGEQPQPAPFVKADLIGSTGKARASSEVLMTGKDSEGRDSPIVNFAWQQTAGPMVTLLKRNNNTVAFTAPAVTEATTLTFQLTVTDANNKSASTSLSVEVVPVQDSDRFLTYLLAPNKFRVVAATREATALAADTSVTITVQPRVTYPGRDGVLREYFGPVQQRSGSWLAASGTGGDDAGAFNNLRFLFDVPAIDTDDINTPYLDAPADSPLRDNILDLGEVPNAQLDLLISMTCNDPCIDDVGADNSKLLVLAGSDVVASDDALADGVTELTLPVEALRTGNMENAATAQAYYDAIDPQGLKTTLDEWLAANCMDRSLADWGADAHAVYTNNYDLGFGRDMYIVEDCGGVTASIVVNYPSLEAAAKKLGAFIAVAMEWTTAADPSSVSDPTKPFATFYTFAPDANDEFVRVGSANFDGRGEKYMPGVCTACHGGEPPIITAQPDGSLVYPDGGDIGAIFMPWDLDSFLYSDTDPAFSVKAADTALRQQYTRANQQAALKALNSIVLSTYDADVPVRDLVEGWYGGPGLPSATFDGEFILPGWSAEPDLYLDVFAQNCRACHVQALGPDRPDFSSYDSFVAQSAQVIDTVFNESYMPMARLTMDRFWVDGNTPPAGDLLLAHFGLDADQVPGRPIATLSGCPNTISNQQSVVLSGVASEFAAAVEWEITARPAASTAQLTGATTFEPGLLLDQPGEWAVTLTVTNEAGTTDSEVCTFTADSAAPSRDDSDSFTLNEGGSASLSASTLSFSDIDSGVTELVYTTTTCPTAGTLDFGAQTCASGTPLVFSQADINAGLVSYQHDGTQPDSDPATADDAFQFTLTDGTTIVDNQNFDIFVSPVNDLPEITLNAAISVQEAASGAITGAQLQASDEEDNNSTLLYTVTANPTKGTLNKTTFTQADLASVATQPVYSHDGSQILVPQTDSFSFIVSDSDGASTPPATFTINLEPFNNGPTVDQSMMDVTEDVTANLSGSLATSDPDNSTSELTVTLESLPVHGTLRIDGVDAVLSDSLSQQQIDDGSLTYVPNANNTTNDMFMFTVADPDNLSASGTFVITMIAVNDPPQITSTPVPAWYGQQLSLNGGVTITDVDNTPSQLTITIDTAPSYGTLVDTNGGATTAADLASGAWQYNGQDCPTTDPDQLCLVLQDNQDSDSFTFTVSDPGGETDSATATISLAASFVNNVNPLFNAANQDCTTACHDVNNSAGFNLDQGAAANYTEIRTHVPVGESQPRVINTGTPTNSLILTKPTGTAPTGHTGGTAFGTNSNSYRLLLDWITNSCPGPAGETGCTQ